jgi:hypothetical protein
MEKGAMSTINRHQFLKIAAGGVIGAALPHTARAVQAGPATHVYKTVGECQIKADVFFVHTFCRLVPPEKHFAAHPEYFSLVGGKRQDGYAQLCCTNEDVIRICTEEVRAAMRAQPEATVFSVSPNDTDKYCECPRCQALAQEEGTQAAPVLHLVNRVAEAVEKEFPGKAVETLAYHWSRRAPKHLRPRPNVIVRLCSIECCFSHALATCDSPANQAFCQDLRDWAKVAPRLWVWDYVVDFDHYLLPFPNQRVRGPNIRLFVDYTIMERARATRARDPGLAELAARRFEPFLKTLAASGVTQLREGRKLNVDDYRAELAKALVPKLDKVYQGDAAGKPTTFPDREIRVGTTEGDIRGADQQALQQAVDRMADQGGGIVRVGPGRYVFRNALQLRNQVRVIGTPGKTILASCDGAKARLAQDAAPGDRQIVLADAADFRVGDGVQIRDNRAQYNFTDKPLTLTEKIGEKTFRLSAPLGQPCAVAREAIVVRAFQLIGAYNVSRATVEGLVLDGNRAKAEVFASSGGTGAGIYLYACDHVTVRDCTVRNYRGDGISFQWGSHDVTIEDCLAENCQVFGLHPGSDSHHSTVRRNQSVGNGTGMFVCVAVHHVLFEKNEFRNNQRAGIMVGSRDTENLFRENTIVGNGRNGVLFLDAKDQGNHRNVLERNTILDNGLAAKDVGPLACITIEGVHDGLVFRDNTLGNTQPGGPVRIGIFLGSGAKGITNQGNRFLNLEEEIRAK